MILMFKEHRKYPKTNKSNSMPLASRKRIKTLFMRQRENVQKVQ